MSVYKPFITSDVIVTPFEVNKSFIFKGGNILTGSDIGIERYLGQNIQEVLWTSGSNPTGQSYILNKKLVYDSIKQLYYTNFLKSPSGSQAATASFNLDGTITGPAPTTNYYNYLGSTLNINRSFPTESNAKIGVTSIPSNLYGEYIKPGSFNITSPSGSIVDDAEGNLIFSSSFWTASYTHVGNIIYEHGIAVWNKKSFGLFDGYGYVTYGQSSPSQSYGIYGGAFDSFFENNVTCSFKSTTTIFESQYKCTARPNEFLFTLNPSIISGSKPCPDNITSTLYDFATGSYFTPYVTTIGLYNNDKELIAVGKLAQPLDMSDTTDTTILVNLDL
jgi:hypothetical protein